MDRSDEWLAEEMVRGGGIQALGSLAWFQGKIRPTLEGGVAPNAGRTNVHRATGANFAWMYVSSHMNT